MRRGDRTYRLANEKRDPLYYKKGVWSFKRSEYALSPNKMSKKVRKMRSRKDTIATGTSKSSLGNISLARFLAERFDQQNKPTVRSLGTKEVKYTDGEVSKSSDLSLQDGCRHFTASIEPLSQ